MGECNQLGKADRSVRYPSAKTTPEMKDLPRQKMRPVNLLVIHCSATREDRPYPPAQLVRDHMACGFNGMGYHYYIRRDGEVAPGRPLQTMGAHAKGHNLHSIGICYEGGLDKNGTPADTRTPEQKAALEKLIKTLLARFPGCAVCGHRDLSPDRNADGVISPHEWMKACPCFDAREEYRRLTEANPLQGAVPPTQAHPTCNGRGGV